MDSKIKVKNLKDELNKWLNHEVFIFNNSNVLDDLDQLLVISKQYKTVLKECRAKKMKFNDPKFIKNSLSLMGYHSKDKKIAEKMNFYAWESFEKFFNPPFIIFKEIDFDDIV